MKKCQILYLLIVLQVSVHLIFPIDRPATVAPSVHQLPQDSETCSANELQSWATSANGTARRRLGLSYPINVARNVARSLAPSQRVLVSDVELLPSEGLASRFLAMLKTRIPKRAVAFVLPVFEVDSGIRPPRNKAELLAALSSGVAVYFHRLVCRLILLFIMKIMVLLHVTVKFDFFLCLFRFLCPHCQRFPGLTRWIVRPDPGKVKPLIITKREYPHNRWEPIFIGTKYDPLYTEEMSWEGRQDKMTQVNKI